MKSLQTQIRINAPRERVFEFLTDPAAAKAWVVGLVDTVPSAPGSLQVVGAKFKERIKEGGRITEYDGEILAYDRPQTYAVGMDSAQFSLKFRYSLDPLAGETVVRQSADISPKSRFFRFLFPLFRFFTRLMLKKQLSQLKAAVEGLTIPPKT